MGSSTRAGGGTLPCCTCGHPGQVHSCRSRQNSVPAAHNSVIHLALVDCGLDAT